MIQAIGLQTHDNDHVNMAGIVHVMKMMRFPSTDQMVGGGIFCAKMALEKCRLRNGFF